MKSECCKGNLIQIKNIGKIIVVDNDNIQYKIYPIICDVCKNVVNND